MDNRIKIPNKNGVKHEDRLTQIGDWISQNYSRRAIIKKCCEAWNLPWATCTTLYKEAILWLQETTLANRETIRTINNERLDGLLDEAKSVKEKVKIIDVINKTNGIYEQTINVGNKDDEEIRFEIAKPTKKSAEDTEDE